MNLNNYTSFGIQDAPTYSQGGRSTLQVTSVPQRAANVQTTAPGSTFQPAANTAQMYGSFTGGGGGTTTKNVDTGYWVGGTNYGSAAGYQNAVATQKARDNFNQGTNVLRDSYNSRANSEGLNYKNSVLDWATGVTNQQQGIDSKAVNAEMAKSQGYNGIVSMVGQGIKSGGVMLGNRNAGSSSGAEAIASAYSKLGQRQASGVNNQYGQAQNQIGLEQSQLEASKALQLGKFNDYKTQVTNSIIDDARAKVAALNEAAANASIADRLDIAAEVERVKGVANAQLQQYDNLLGAAKGATSADARRQEAQRLANLGTAPDQSFNYSTEAPAQFQNTGPFASEMPLWTYGSNRNKYQG